MMRGYPGYGPGVSAGHFGLFGGLLGGLLVLLMIAAVVVLIVMLARRPHGMHPGQGGPHHMAPASDPYAEALAVAARRLASGEITPAQYEEIRAALYRQPQAPPPAGDETTPMPPSE